MLPGIQGDATATGQAHPENILDVLIHPRSIASPPGRQNGKTISDSAVQNPHISPQPGLLMEFAPGGNRRRLTPGQATGDRLPEVARMATTQQ